jgi:hypothetical protein
MFGLTNCFCTGLTSSINLVKTAPLVKRKFRVAWGTPIQTETDPAGWKKCP